MLLGNAFDHLQQCSRQYQYERNTKYLRYLGRYLVVRFNFRCEFIGASSLCTLDSSGLNPVSLDANSRSARGTPTCAVLFIFSLSLKSSLPPGQACP